MTATTLLSSLTYSISPARHRQRRDDDDQEEEYILTLAPFTRPPKINFGTVKLNSFVERSLLIFNPQQFPVELNINSTELNINNIRLRVDQMENVNLKLKWQPDRVDYFKYSIFFEVTNSARLKFVVHAYGVCVKPDPKKTSMGRKPFAMLQPVKKEKTHSSMPVVNENAAVIVQKPLNNPVVTSIVSNKENKPRMNMRVSQKYLHAKQNDRQFAEFYINEFNRDIQEEDDEENCENGGEDTFDRRKTCIIKSTKICKSADHLDLDDDLNQIVTSSVSRLIASTTIAKTPTIRRTSSVNDIDDSSIRFNTLYESAIFMDQTVVHHQQHQESSSPRTPKLSDYVRSPVTMTVIRQTHHQQERRSLNQTITTTNYANQTILIAKNDETVCVAVDQRAQLLPKYVVIIQRAWRMKAFRRAVAEIKQATELERVKCLAKNAVLIQKAWRMKNFRRAVTEIKQSIEAQRVQRLTKNAAIVQRAWRLKRFRRAVAEIKQAIENQRVERLTKNAVIIQKAWRMKMFRRAVAEIKQSIEDERARILAKNAVIVQKAWRMKTFRRAVAEIKQAIEIQRVKRLTENAIIVQKAWRMKTFRRAVASIKQEIEKEKELEHQLLVLKYTLKVQRAYRMKRFRRHLQECKAELMRKYTIMVQQQWRMIKFRKHLAQLQLEERERKYQAELLIQTTKCQQWLRYKLFRKNLIRLRAEKEEHLKLLNKSACVIQKQWRMYKFRASMRKYRRSALAIQTAWRGHVERKQFLRVKHSACVIQTWFRSMKPRLQFIKLKRSLPLIQQQCRRVVKERNESASKIQQYYRYVRFRRAMSVYRTAAITIQHWFKSDAYRKSHETRVTCAVKIQCQWRVYKARARLTQLREEFKMLLLHASAIKIQSVWRGYSTRKQTEPLFQSIRMLKQATVSDSSVKACDVSVLSRTYENAANTSMVGGNSMAASAGVTLGQRIRHSLQTLNQPYIALHQIVVSLNELDTVTRLSPECCHYFVRERAVNILYHFISNCNRSVPHQDLIKLCLQVFLNLAKYKNTCHDIIYDDVVPATSTKSSTTGSSSNTKLNVLLTLLQSYQASSPVIFVHVCVILIVLANNADTKQVLLKPESGVIKKLETIASLLERKSQLRSKHAVVGGGGHGNSSSSGKEAKFMFNLQPDWTLSTTFSLKFNDQLQAITHLIKTLVSKTNSSVHPVAKKPIAAKVVPKVETKKPPVSSTTKQQQVVRPPVRKATVAPPKPQVTRPQIKRATSTTSISAVVKTQTVKPVSGLKRTASMATISSNAKSHLKPAAVPPIKKTRSVLGVNTISASVSAKPPPPSSSSLKRTASTTFIQPPPAAVSRMATRSTTNMAKRKPPVVEKKQPHHSGMTEPSSMSISSNDTTYHSVNSSIKSVTNLRTQKPRLNSTVIKKQWV